MKKNRGRSWILGIIGCLALLFCAGWWLMHRKQKQLNGNPVSIITNSANEAKTKMAKMSMQLQGMTITEIKNKTVYAQNTVRLKNPLPVALNLSGLDYAVLVGKVQIAEGRYSQPVKIPASGSTTVSLPLRISTAAIDRLNDKWKQQKRDTAVYSFINTIHTDIPVAGEKSFQVTIHESLPMVWAPTLKPGDLDIRKFGLKNSGLRMAMQVTNPNSFEVRMKEGTYSMRIDGEPTVTGKLESPIVLPAEETTSVPLQMHLKTGKALKMGWKALFKKKNTKYWLRFDGQLASNEKMLKNCRLHFTNEGTLSDLMKTLENQ